ncbi:Nucleic acid-binding, OB-fold [Sesbania bispinosa]|nr:Nucleic acid-binding, OB-fold [Sesbania bispinosa]
MVGHSFVCHLLKDVTLSSEGWTIKACVNRMWGVSDYVSPFGIASVELVLIDSQATIPKEYIKAIQKNIVEEGVYYFKNMVVLPNKGTYKPTQHMYKLLFQHRSQVMEGERDFISTLGIIPMSNWQIVNYKAYFDNLVDFVGVVTAVSLERDYVHGGAVKKYICLEITDHTGKVECMLFEEYVSCVKEFIRCFGRTKPIVAVQYARVVPAAGPVFGELLIQNHFTATRLLFNPTIPTIVDFKNRMSCMGLKLDGCIGSTTTNGSAMSLVNDFLVLHPRKTIGELLFAAECRTFVVLATVVNIIEDGKWWLLQKGCECHSTDPIATRYPAMFGALIGKKLLFKVETKCSPPSNGQCVLPVSRVCDDDGIIEKFVHGDTMVTSHTDGDSHRVFLVAPSSKGKEVVVESSPEGSLLSEVPLKGTDHADGTIDLLGNMLSVNMKVECDVGSTAVHDASTSNTYFGDDIGDLNLRM